MRSHSGNRTYPGWQILVVVLLLGAILGGWVGEALIKIVPSLANIGHSFMVGIPRFDLDLKVLSLVFGLTVKLNLFSLLGLIAGFLVYRKM